MVYEIISDLQDAWNQQWTSFLMADDRVRRFEILFPR